MREKFYAWAWSVALLALVAAIFPVVTAHAVEAATFEIDVFFRDEGGGCTDCGYDEFPIESDVRLSVRRAFYEKINDGQVVFNIYNLYRDEQFNVLLESRLADFGIDNLRMPAFFTQDGYYFGGIRAINQLQEHLEEQGFGVTVRQVPYMPEGTVVTPRDDRPYGNIFVGDSVVVYFYTPWCPFCYEISPIMNNLPEYVMINGQKSYVRLVSYNRDIDADHEIIRRYHDMFNIAEERRFVPLVLVGYRDLFLYDEVSEGLIAALEAGEGLLTPLFGERRPSPGAALVWPLILAGVVLATAILLLVIRNRKKRNLP